jgi:hypothetical protein
MPPNAAITAAADWIPGIVSLTAAIVFAGLWRRATAKADTEMAVRVATLETQANAAALAEAKADYVDRTQHNALAQSLRDAIKATDLDVRELKTRISILERKS